MGTAPRVRPLTVPERHISAFNLIRSLKDGDYAKLLGSLGENEPSTPRSVLADSVHGACALEASVASELLDAVFGLASVGHKTGSPPAQIAARVASSAQFSDSDDDRLRFERRIELLLDCDVVRIQGKASSLGTAHERVFLSAQILTDLRPLFHDQVDGDPEPEGALLSHTLLVHFIDSTGSHDNFFVVLDDGDLEALNQATNRAIAKSASLKQKLHDSALVYMASEE